MNSYHLEQINALTLVQRYLNDLSESERIRIDESTTDYLNFRREVDRFLDTHFIDICTQTCFRSRLSACCSREGIITFFGDVVVNRLVSTAVDADILLAVLAKPNKGFKCVYLAKSGCMWRLKPIVCEMYLCDRAKEEVFGNNSPLRSEWERLERKRKRFTWPDRPVLFDDLEARFIEAGYQSPLMYLHNSPGLLRVKQKAGLVKKRG